MKVTEAECNLKCDQILTLILYKLKNQFRKHYKLFQTALEDQTDLLDSLWVQCQRYLILTRGALCVQPYPRELSVREEREIHEKFRTKKDRLKQSNSRLASSLFSLKEKCLAFDTALAKVDASLPSSIIDGNPKRKPIFYYIEMFADLYRGFHNTMKQLDLLGKSLMVDDMASILEYQKLLKENGKLNVYYEECWQINNKSFCATGGKGILQRN